MRRRFSVISVLLILVASTAAQGVDDEDFQSWNDLQINVSLSKRFDYYNKLTMRFGDNVSRLRDGRFSVGLTYRPTSSLLISPFYWYVKARNTAGQFRVENRLNVAASYRFPTKRLGLSHRSTYEYRMRRPVNTWRYRAMITAEKELPKSFIQGAKVFASDEVFYDSATDKFSRNRFSIGLAKSLSRHVGVDLYYTRQNDGFSRPGDLNIIGTAWKIRP